MSGIRGPVEEERLAGLCVLLDEVQPLFDVHLCQVGLSRGVVYVELLIIPERSTEIIILYKLLLNSA